MILSVAKRHKAAVSNENRRVRAAIQRRACCCGMWGAIHSHALKNAFLPPQSPALSSLFFTTPIKHFPVLKGEHAPKKKKRIIQPLISLPWGKLKWRTEGGEISKSFERRPRAEILIQINDSRRKSKQTKDKQTNWPTPKLRMCLLGAWKEQLEWPGPLKMTKSETNGEEKNLDLRNKRN